MEPPRNPQSSAVYEKFTLRIHYMSMILSQAYHHLVDQTTHALGASHAIMHVHIGLALYLGMQLLLRTRRASFAALHVVFVAELLNECLDWLANQSWNWPDTLSDMLLTLMWPIAITAVGHYRRARWNRVAKTRQLVRLRRKAWGVASGQ